MKKSTAWLIILGLVVVLVGMFLIVGSGRPSVPTPVPAPQTVIVTYEVGGARYKADITINNATGGTEQKTVDIPWHTKFRTNVGQFLYVSAQIDSDRDSEVTCKILVNDRVIQQASSKGAFAIASCSGSAK